MPRQEGPYLGPRHHWTKPRTPKAWQRHWPWLVPLGFCGVFLVLIVGAMQIRQLIIRRIPSGSNGQIEQQLESKPPEHGPKQSAQSAVPAPVDPALQSSEPGYQVLPPAAARAPGRKLPKMLLVGDRPEMFPSLEEALNVAISGDIIEIRTNRPIIVTSATYHARDEKNGDTLTIRGGVGFQPVLRHGKKRPYPADLCMFKFVNTKVKLAGLHFTSQNRASREGFVFFDLGGGGEVIAHDCSFTGSAKEPGSVFDLNLYDRDLQKDPRAAAANVHLERCFFRGHTLGVVRCNPLVASVHVQNSLLMNWSVARSFGFAPSPVPTPPDCRRELLFRNNTMVSDIVLSYGHVPDREAESRIWITAENNVFVTSLVLEHSASADYYDMRSLVGSHYKWSGRGNLFDVRTNWSQGMAVLCRGRPSVNNGPYQHVVRVGANLSEWNSFWGSQAEIESEMGTAPFVREIDFQNHWKTLPTDYELRPVGPVEQLARRGIRVGCDISQIPVPPPATLEPYELNP